MAPKLELPDKLYFKIGEVARLLSVPSHVLRYWEQQFPMLRPHKSRGGQRLYRRGDVELLIKIKNLVRDRKFTIAGARKTLNDERIKARALAPAENFEKDAEEDEEESVESLKEEIEKLKQERKTLIMARSATTKQLEAKQKALEEIRSQVFELLESLDEDDDENDSEV